MKTALLIIATVMFAGAPIAHHAFAQDVDDAKPKGSAAKAKPTKPVAKKLDFTLRTSDGKNIQLSKLKQDIVVLEWVNQDCPFVRPHYSSGSMQKLAMAHSDKVAWIGIDSTHGREAKSVEAFRKEHKVKHPIAMDVDGKVGKMFAAKCTPHMFVLYKGEVVYQGAIDSKQQKDVKSPINYVQKAVTQLLAGKPVTTKEVRPYGCSVKYAKSSKEKMKGTNKKAPTP